ncbi:phage tail-like protein [Krasilnikovia cinnamomea]|uniref:Phage tail-like protein n=1 Tax=Krasilnikovia cinnamomea TaxID=349313 RepID=A0A4Q7ZKT6_9ACTN|nr:phage tail protein [Krasilnikovia cinnamomea]RZU51560.1 phage tail-like protein [Krasilnikovia cinnamomea]
MQQLSDNARLGMSMRFRVSVDGINLGSWASCAGLSVDFKNKAVAEGGNYEYSVILPERVEYRTITLRRAMSLQESAMVQQWLTGVVNGWYNAASPRDFGHRSAKIELFDAGGPPKSGPGPLVVASWTLRNVYPARWVGPDLDATGSRVAVETLELVHEGFL